MIHSCGTGSTTKKHFQPIEFFGRSFSLHVNRPIGSILDEALQSELIRGPDHAVPESDALDEALDPCAQPLVSHAGEAIRSPHAWISTGEPGGSSLASVEIAGFASRTQPCDTACPSSDPFAVPCRAIWPSPVPNWSKTSE
jgi:hypothetical protein